MDNSDIPENPEQLVTVWTSSGMPVTLRVPRVDGILPDLVKHGAKYFLLRTRDGKECYDIVNCYSTGHWV